MGKRYRLNDYSYYSLAIGMGRYFQSLPITQHFTALGCSPGLLGPPWRRFGFRIFPSPNEHVYICKARRRKNTRPGSNVDIQLRHIFLLQSWKRTGCHLAVHTRRSRAGRQEKRKKRRKYLRVPLLYTYPCVPFLTNRHSNTTNYNARRCNEFHPRRLRKEFLAPPLSRFYYLSCIWYFYFTWRDSGERQPEKRHKENFSA
jgi:hypothetical protein